MRVVAPVTVTPAMLTTNVPMNDAPAHVIDKTYAKGDLVVANYHVFRSLADANKANPLKDDPVPKWLDTGAVNAMRMFDKGAAQPIGDTQNQQRVFMIGTKTSNPGSIEIVIRPGAVVSAVALFGLAGFRATVKLVDPVDGVVYERVETLVDPSCRGMWEWLFKPLRRKKTLALLDLPAYGTAAVHILIEAGAGAVASCAMAVVGQLTEIGESCFGTSIGITDFSNKKVDDFGNEFITERGYRDRVQFDVRIPTGDVSYAKDVLTDLRATGAVYIGDENRQETIIFGRYRDLQIVLDNPSMSPCALDVGSLL